MAGFAGMTVFNTVMTPNWVHVNCCAGGTFGYACDRDGIIPARSLHPGGVQLAIADGAVRFFSDSVDLQTYQYLVPATMEMPCRCPSWLSFPWEIG